ncbi:MAG: restriction endonuclease subunit S [Ruminococcus sp.]|nr:restriction endonuclease subunit S [Ruminococcus sp.]
MSELQRFIKKLCPDGVVYVKIKDYFTRLKGTPITAGKMKEIARDEGKIRIFAGGKTVINANEKDIPKANIIKVPAVLVQSRGLIDFIYYENPFTFKNEMWAYTVENKISVKFLYYVLKNNTEFFRTSASGMGSLPQISLSVTEDFKIPFPPLEIQKEIVRILDEYSEKNEKLIKELYAETELRKKQYSYYRDKMLDFGDDVEWKTLEEITVKISSGKNKEKNQEGTYPVYGSTGIIAYCEKYKYDKKQILIARVGANAGYVHIAKEKYDVSDNTIMLDIKDTVLFKYIYYLLINMNLNKYAKGGGQPLVTAGQIKEIKIPIPPIEEQERIVKILDHFDILYNDLTNGISTEIEARKKQYEYYRNKLLTFKEKQ